MCVRSVLYLLAFILAGGLLFIVVVIAHAYRDRHPGFSYFAYGMTAPKDQDF